MSLYVTRWGSSLAVIFLLLLGHVAVLHAASSIEDPLGDCTEEMVRGLFQGPPERTQIRAFIARLNGNDDASRRFGMKVGNSLRDALDFYAREALVLEKDGLSPRNVLVKFKGCAIADHDHARLIGQAAGADVVLWGKTYCDWRKPKQCLNVDLRGAIIGSYNVQKNSPQAQMNSRVTIQLPNAEEPEQSFKTSLTVVNWVGLDADPDPRVAFSVQRTSELARADLPKLASKRPLMMLDFVLGLYAFRAQRHGLAVKFFQRSQNSVSAGIEGVQDLYGMMGTSYMIAGEPELGLQALKRAIEVCQPGDDKCRDVGLNNLGIAEEHLGRKAEALGHYLESLELSRKQGRHEGEASTLSNIGRLYFYRGDRKKALEMYDKALSLCKQVRYRDGEATVLNNIGRLYLESGDTKKALEFYELALPILHEVGNQRGEATTLNNMGQAYSRLSDAENAMKLYRQARPIFHHIGDLGGEALILNNIGTLHSSMFETQEALDMHSEALSLFVKIGDIRGEAATFTNIGAAYLNQEKPQKALEKLNQALKLFQQIKDPQGEASALVLISRVYSKLGEKKRALETSEQAVVLFNQIGDIYGTGIALEDLATALAALNRSLEAIVRYQEAATMYRKRKPPALDGARGSLRLAFYLALRHHMGLQAGELLRTLTEFAEPEIDLALLQAQYLGHFKAPEAIAAYQKLSVLAASFPIEQKNLIEIFVRAGQMRSKHRVRWSECPGVVVTKVSAESPAMRLGIAVGDVLLRYNGACLYERADLAESIAKTAGATAVPLELWRGGAPVKLTAVGDKLLGIEVDLF